METTTQPVFSVRRIVVTGMLGAIAILLGYTRLGFIPVPTPAGNATIMHIPAIIGGVLEGWQVGAAIGAIFGVFSFLQSTTPIFKDPLVAILPRLFIGITPFFVYHGLRRINRTAGFIIAALILILVGVFMYNVLTFTPKELVFDFGGDPASPWIHLTGQTALTVYQILGGAQIILGVGAAIAFAYFVYRNQMELLAVGTAAIVGTLTNTILVLSMIVLRGYLTADVALGIGITQGIPEIIVAVIVTVAVVSAWKGIESGTSGGARKV